MKKSILITLCAAIAVDANARFRTFLFAIDNCII